MFYNSILFSAQTFSLYPYISSEPMHAGKMFSSLALIYTLHGPITIMPLFIGVVAHSTVSMKRLGRFLTHTDMDTQVGEEGGGVD